MARRVEADKEAFETWMGISADDGMGLQQLSDSDLEQWWDAGTHDTGSVFDPENAGRPDELLRRLGPPPRKLGLSDLPDLLAPAYSLIANAVRQLIIDPGSAIKPVKNRR